MSDDPRPRPHDEFIEPIFSGLSRGSRERQEGRKQAEGGEGEPEEGEEGEEFGPEDAEPEEAERVDAPPPDPAPPGVLAGAGWGGICGALFLLVFLIGIGTFVYIFFGP